MKGVGGRRGTVIQLVEPTSDFCIWANPRAYIITDPTIAWLRLRPRAAYSAIRSAQELPASEPVNARMVTILQANFGGKARHWFPGPSFRFNVHPERNQAEFHLMTTFAASISASLRICDPALSARPRGHVRAIGSMHRFSNSQARSIGLTVATARPNSNRIISFSATRLHTVETRNKTPRRSSRNILHFRAHPIC